mgnify:CR=1 FL=1
MIGIIGAMEAEVAILKDTMAVSYTHLRAHET